MHGDKECPFSGVTNSGRVWRKVPESEARSVSSSVSAKGVIRSALAATVFTIVRPGGDRLIRSGHTRFHGIHTRSENR